MSAKVIASYFAAAIRWTAFAALGGLTFALDVPDPPAEAGPIFLQGAVVWAKHWATELGVAILLALGSAELLRWASKHKSKEQIILDKMAREAIERFRLNVFPALPDNVADHHNRVTLFKKVTFVWCPWPMLGPFFWPWGNRFPWSGWLVIAKRSGYVTQNSWIAFPASDDGKTEGVAGKAFQAGAVRARDLPDLSSFSYVPVVKRWLFGVQLACGRKNAALLEYGHLRKIVTEYAQTSHSRPAAVWHRLRCKKTCPTNILGTRLEASDGTMWGVAVMDSANSLVCIDSRSKKFRAAWKNLCKRLVDCGTVP